VACTALDACHLPGTCDPTSGACSNPLKPTCPPGLPPDPATVAPPLDRTVATSTFLQTQFLYAGSLPIQTGVSPGTIDPQRVCELHGQVSLDSGVGAPGVTIRVVGHPEFGQTKSRLDGRFNLVVNGGSTITLDYQGLGYLPIERTVTCPWQQLVSAPPVIVVPPDPNVSTLVADSSSYQIARGSVVTDADGTRQGVVVVPPGTTAGAELPNGTTTPLENLSVRVTEYTVGPNGDQRMPADLPPDSAYTYAFEVNADEALAAGATGVQLSQPVIYYNDNFLKFPAGTVVPLGSYTRSCTTGACGSGSCGGWVPSQTGLVINVVSVTAGVAGIDSNGDGVVDSTAVLSAAGITTAELQTIAQLYAPGKSIWRVLLPHFSSWDSNWGYGPPPDAIAPNVGTPTTDVSADCRRDVGGANVDSLSQTAGESLPIVGTPYNLVYQSDRVDGRTSGRTVVIPLTGATLPASVTRIDLEVQVAGQTFDQSFAPAPNLSHTFTWDGLDSFGRELQGGQTIAVHIGYVYNGFYQQVAAFGYKGNGIPISGDHTRRQVTLYRDTTVTPSVFDVTAFGLGGWNIDIHHAYDPSGALYRGDGRTVKATALSAVITALAGGGSTPAISATTATQAKFGTTDAAVVAPDGSVYVIDHYDPAIYKIAPSGAITRVAGTGIPGYNGDEIPATNAMIAPYIGRIAMARECDGGFYFVDWYNNRVRYVDANGIIHTVAGNGVSGNLYNVPADGMLARNASFSLPIGIAVAPDGSFYISDAYGAIYRVGLDGVLSRAAGVWGVRGNWNSADGLPAREDVIYPNSIAVGRDGTLYEQEWGGIRRVGSDGIITTIAGRGTSNSVDGVPATSANLQNCNNLALGADGTLYTFCAPDGLLAIAPDGIMHVIAGEGPYAPSGTGGPAKAAQVAPAWIGDIAAAPDGSIVTSEGSILRRIVPALPTYGVGQYDLSSGDGRELFVFDASGRHLQTIDALTGAVRYSFNYDSNGRLVAITDIAGNITKIQRDASGAATSIASPYGQTTLVSTGTDGLLASIVNPASQASTMTYAASQHGLLATFTDAAGAASQFAYDGSGRLVAYTNAAGGGVTLASTITPAELQVAQSTALGAASSFTYRTTAPGVESRVYTLPNGLNTTQNKGADGSVVTTLPNGTTTTVVETPDPRFGMTAPIAGTLSVLTPAGLSYQQSGTRKVALANSLNPLSLTALTDTTTVDPVHGLTFTSAYTATNRSWTMTTPASRTRALGIDASGRLTSTQRGSLLPETFSYDAHGRLSAIAQGARARSYAYDPLGMVTQVTDPLHQVTAYQRDDAGRVIGETLADGQTAAFSYDGAGRLLSIVAPAGDTHRFTRSPLGTLASYIAPAVAGISTSATHYAYDADGHLTTVARPDGTTIRIAYDGAGRAAGVTLPETELAFAYDPNTGRLSTANGPGDQQVAYGYDGVLTKQTTWSGGVRGQVVWGYDNSLKVVSESVNGTGVSFAYDADGLLTQAGAMVLAPSATTGLLTGTSLGAVIDAFTYDSFGERATYASKYQATELLSETYTRDALGRITAKSESVQGATHQYAYAYDARGRLTDVTKDSASVGHWTYDANGNRVGATTSSGSVAATYDARDRLVTFGTFTYTYGAADELQTKTDTSTGLVTQYVYDALGNLTHVSLPTGHFIDYGLDAAGRRVSKSVDGNVVQQWLYRDALRPIAELDGGGNIVSRFVYADKATADGSALESLYANLGLARTAPRLEEAMAPPTYVVEGARTLRILTDHLGSPRLVVDASTGTVVQSVDFDAWGVVLTAAGADIPTLGFAGGLYDPDTGFVRFGARDYDPQTGRWTSPEPMKTAGELNFYEYAGSDPVNGSDADGLAQVPCPDEQTVLDSICGPNAEGEVHCTVHESVPTVEQTVSTQGALVGASTDSTTEPTPSQDLPTLSIDGNATTSVGTVGSGGGAAPVNQPPTVSVGSGSTLTVNFPANNIPLSGRVTDDGLLAGFPLQVLWYTAQGPAAAVFSNENVATTSVTLPVGGVYQLVLSAYDGEYTRSATLTVTVNQAPAVTATGPTNVAVGDTPIYIGSATEPVAGDTLMTAWIILSGPGTVTFGSPASLTTTAQFSAPGSYVLQFEASDGALTSAATVPVTVVAQASHALVVNAGPNQTLTAPNLSTTLSGTATDSGQPPGSTLTYTWTVSSAPVAVMLSTPTQASTGVSFSYPGTYVFQLAVSDSQNIGAASVTVTVNPQSTTSSSAPTVSMSGLSDNGVVTKPTQVLGNVSEGSWVLEYRLGGRDDVQTAWTVLASGTSAVVGGVLGTFDPTLLLNGLYTVSLSAQTSAGSTSTTLSVPVDGRMKVGNFTLTFTDLETAVAGLPFQIDRTYDSRDKTVGDFGIGWRLGIGDVRVEKSGKIGAYWTQILGDDVFFPQYCLEPAQAESVTITFPSGREYRFAPQSSPECQYLEPLTSPDIVWQCTSDPNSPTIKLQAVNGTSVFTQSTTGPAQLLTDQSDIWDPRQFTLTVEDGTVYQIDQDQGVTQVQDRRGNMLTITPGGILHSSGKQVTFVRDSSGKITSITDPAGATMTYAYDDNGDLITYVDRASNTTQFVYASDHYLDQIQDPLGRLPIRNTYDASGRLVSQTDATGNTVEHAPNLAANQEQVTDRLGHVTLYQYNDRGDVTQKTDATGAVWTYTFDPYGNKLSETDPLGRTKTTTFDGQNDPLVQTDALGNVTTNTYNQYRQLLTTADPLGHVTTNSYDAYGNLVATMDALGNTTTYTRDAHGNPLTTTDPLGHVTTYVYDAAGDVTQTTDPIGHLTSKTYDANGNKTSETTTRTNASGAVETLLTTYALDALGHVTATVYPDGTTTSTAYTATGKRASSTDELGRTTNYAHDMSDRLVTTTRPDATTVTQGYDAENHRTSMTDPAGNTNSYAYDPVGRLMKTTFADGNGTSTTYDAAGQAIATTDELGHATQAVFDAAGRRTSTSDPTGATTQFGYDAAGNQTSIVDALGHTTSTAYDAMNRAVATTYADSSAESMTYDAAGRTIAKTDTLGRVTAFAYDALGRLISVTDALGQVTQYGYDELGHRVSQTDANGHVTKFAFDKRGREVGRTLPDGSAESEAYDAAGELQTRTDFLGRATAYGYDLLGQLLTRTYPDKSVVGFTYTPDGRRATEVDTRGTTTYSYDSRRRVVLLTYPDGRSLLMGYDAHGDRTSLTARIGTQSWTTATGYDSANRPNKVTDPLGRAFGIGYDADGNRKQLADPNTTTTAYVYDARNRLRSLTTTQTATGLAPATTQSYAYALDVAGRRMSVTEADGTVRAYGYDGIDRLTGETVTGPLSYAKTFAYDPVGNRTTQTTTGSAAATVTYSYDTRDRMTTENTTSYAYDANGNVTSKSGEAAYTWDYENRLVGVAMTSGATVSDQYDADGNRVQTTVTPSGASALTTNMLVDTTGGLSQVVAETDGGGNVTAIYVRAGDELLEVMRPGSAAGTWSTRFVHHDGLSSVRALTDETGATADTRAYEAFGTKNVEVGSDPLTYGFAGEAFEGTSMLAYQRARWMDARVGRFEGMDPERGDELLPLSLNTYIYAGSEPVDQSDPSGDEYDMASIGAAIGADAVLSTLATAGVTVLAADIVCTAVNYANVDADGDSTNMSVNTNGPCGRFLVRLQAQGPSKTAPGNDLQKSVVLGNVTPISVAEGLLGLEALKLQLTRTERRDREDQFDRAETWIERGPPNGYGPPGRSFNGRNGIQPSIRVDVEIKSGINFVSPL